MFYLSPKYDLVVDRSRLGEVIFAKVKTSLNNRIDHCLMLSYRVQIASILYKFIQ